MQLPHVSSNQVVETPKWSEEDIPIFSVKADEQNAPATGISNSGKINVALSDAKMAKTDKATQEHVGKAPAFKQSDLTREEHAQYLKLYKKYLGAYSQGGLPSVLGSQQMKELAVFEQLQKRVLREQAEFQDYLKKNAERNPKFYQFLREPARNYSTSRIGAYRLKKEYANLYSSSLCDKISLSPGSGCTQMTHQQTLLEVGVPPLINLPSIPKGKPLTKIPHNMKKIDALFPKFTKKKPHGFIHHDPVSYDVNAKVLVVKHSIQVVMSSSVVSCLFNNQEPSYNHAWNIPVTVEECRSNGKVSKVVYLDKPLFEDDLRVRDYNAIFHKYALRAFVSRVRRQHKRAVTKQGFEHTQHQRVSDPVDEPFDMFDSSVTNLETFGTSGTSAKKFPCDKTLPACRTLKTQSREAVKELNQSNVNPLSPTFAGQLTQPAKSPAQKSLIDRMDMTKRRSRLLMKEDLSSSSSATSLEEELVLKGSPRTRQQAKLLQTNTSPGWNDKSLHGLPAENDTTITEAPIDTALAETANFLSPTQGDHKFLNRTRGSARKCVAEAVQPHCENVHSEDVTESNKNESGSLSSHDGANITSALLDMSGPLSPATSPPSSPQPNTTDAVNQVIREIPSSPVLDGPREIPPVRIIPLSPNMSAVGSGAKDQLQEDPTDFVQPLEDCSSLHYNLWSLGDKKVLIRSSCHGIIKDHKKPRAIYLFPKLEYQPIYGLEQVTVNEMVKNWTSCYIRQNTNLLRARINAFTSEILMYEEMEPHKILQPSLNFKPQNAFKFLDNLLNHLIRLECGKYLLSHDAGADYCGVKQMSVVSDYQTQRPHNSSRKRRAVDETIPWIPIDPTLLLPLHEEKNRIPATFMPKDCVLENPGKKKNDFGHGNNKRNKKPKEKKKKRNKTS
ncbi:unnamed protein product [Lymnaea stagnalis]|uniref:Little elongation complex subunit 2 C-terminal domain-containing protein n=1 Tax=Lymnaea stagnalis TaxID=6523 RepID=A0AAV2HX18_LYMST